MIYGQSVIMGGYFHRAVMNRGQILSDEPIPFESPPFVHILFFHLKFFFEFLLKHVVHILEIGNSFNISIAKF